MKRNWLAIKMLSGRLLTRSGDQAWDFAVPLVLLKLLPGELRIAALYYLIVRLALVFFLPRLAQVIDRVNRFTTAKIGIFLQLAGVVIGALSIWSLSAFNVSELNWGTSIPILSFVSLVFGGILASLGSAFMDIAIANDLVPSSFAEAQLASFNSRLRQLDLLTEVCAPVAAGFLLLLEKPGLPLFGFYLVAVWNIVSFVPEFAILKSIFSDRPDLKEKKVDTRKISRVPFLKRLSSGWRDFFREPIAMSVLAYALLWLSVLSPHGVLLTAFLKDGWKVPEWEIGIFRGLGAVFGLVATAVFPFVVKKFGLIVGSRMFLIFQALTVSIGLIGFAMGGPIGQFVFLSFVLFSRIGLYGFSLGEVQIRQIGIRPEARGEVNGFASALTGVATLGLYAAGAILPSTKDFEVLIIGSVAFVIVATVMFSRWSRSASAKTLN